MAIKNVCSKIAAILESNNNQILASQKNDIQVYTKFQVLFNLKSSNPLEARIIEIILGHAMAAEKLGPGAFDETIKQILNKFCRLSETLSETAYSPIPYPASLADVKELVYKKVKDVDESLMHMLDEALALAGFGGRIVIEKSNTNTSSVELSRGYSFDVTPGWSLSSKLLNAKSFVIDGYIESVSEVHHVLEACSEAKEPAVIFARGFSNDVLHTLRINYDRGTLKLIPIIVRFDLEGINMVNDITAVTGCDMVSCNKGDLISSIKYETAPVIQSIIVYPNKVVIQNEKTSQAVASQINFLRKKRNEATVVEDVGKLYDKRIRSLSPNHVIIRIPETKDFVRYSQTIDSALRTIKSAVDHGLIRQEGTLLPYSSKIAASVHSMRCHETLTGIGAVLL
jgi:hypothetical protein